MNFFKLTASNFAEPGIPPVGALAAAFASTTKELIEGRATLIAPQLFKPALSCGLCFISSSAVGGSRLLNAVESHFRTPAHFRPKPIRNVGSLVLWEMRAPCSAAASRRVVDQAEELSHSAFDTVQQTQAETALITTSTEYLLEAKNAPSKLLARSVILWESQFPDLFIIREKESASRAIKSLRRIMSENPSLHFSHDAVEALEALPLDDSHEQRHMRVKVAKLSAVFYAGRRVLEGGPETISAVDVVAARDMVLEGDGRLFSPPPTDDVEQPDDEEETFFDRVMRQFGREVVVEVPMEIIQTKLRRSRKEGARRVPDLLQALASRGKIRVVAQTQLTTGRGGRPKRIVLLPPAPRSLPKTPCLALPAPQDPQMEFDFGPD